MRKQILISLTLIALSGCTYFPGVYKMDVPQGNHITQEMVDQLRVGMTQSQVRYVMGTPLLVDTFHEARWDYIYNLVEEDQLEQQYRVTLYFQDGLLARIENGLN